MTPGAHAVEPKCEAAELIDNTEEELPLQSYEEAEQAQILVICCHSNMSFHGNYIKLAHKRYTLAHSVHL